MNLKLVTDNSRLKKQNEQLTTQLDEFNKGIMRLEAEKVQSYHQKRSSLVPVALPYPECIRQFEENRRKESHYIVEVNYIIITIPSDQKLIKHNM